VTNPPPPLPPLAGVRKSAILMLSLDEHHAEEILRRVPADAADLVRREMDALRDISDDARSKVLNEYRRELANFESSNAQNSNSQPAAFTIEIPSQPPPTALADMSVADLGEILQDEHPQFICAVLSMMPADKSGQCISSLAVQKQIDVFCRMASLRPLDPRVRDEVIQLMEARRRPVAPLPQYDPHPHPDTELLAQVLDDAHASSSRDAMEIFGEPVLAAPENLAFDDLMKLDDVPLRSLLEEVDENHLAMALRAASRQLRRRIFRILSTDTAHRVRTAADALGPVHLGDVESAQANILRVLHRLESAGEVKLKPARRRK
jgi:flagellar motor switch protein FliG